jgi:hypothetical protein
MTLQVNADYVAKQASVAAGEIVTEIEKVHGPIWASRQELCKLIITCRGFLELSGFVAHELSAFFTLVGKLRRA